MKKISVSAALSLALAASMLLGACSSSGSSQGSSAAPSETGAEHETAAPNIIIPEQEVSEEDERFDEFCFEEFIESVTTDTLTLHFDVADPEAFGISRGEATLGSVDTEYSDDWQQSLEELRETLDGFDYDKLSEDRRLTWDILSEYEHLFPNLPPATLGTKTGPPMKEQTAAAKAKAAEKRPEESAGKAIEGRTKKTQPAAVSDKKGIDNPKNKPYSDLESVMAELSADERAIAFYLLEGPKQADELSIATGLPAARVLAAMTMLQVRGLAEQRAGKVLALTVGDARQTN